MKSAFILFFCVCSIAFVSCYKSLKSSEWINFKETHEKTYTSLSEELNRMQIWMENKGKIENHNKLYSEGKVSYSQGVNQFTDMSAEEVINQYTGFKSIEPTGEYEKRVFIKPTGPVESSTDWRDKGAVTPVKDQGQCGSCYTFSAVQAVEGQHFLKTGKLLSLSEQQILDCSYYFHDNGCNGGSMEHVFNYINQAGGIESEGSYPYRGQVVNQCHYKEGKASATVGGFERIQQSEDALKNAVAKLGPISVAIHVADSFQKYKGGIYYEPNCGGELDHAVLVVGYGSENGHDYWLVKNSWGTRWGDHGYIKMLRNHNNMCGIASEATVPTGVGAKEPNETDIDTKKSFSSASLFLKFVMEK